MRSAPAIVVNARFTWLLHADYKQYLIMNVSKTNEDNDSDNIASVVFSMEFCVTLAFD